MTRSGPKRFRGRKGGSYRNLFKVESGYVLVVKVGNRKNVYERDMGKSKSTQTRAQSAGRVAFSFTLRQGRNYAEEMCRRVLGRSLKRARLQAGLTQGELAKKIRRTQSAVSMAEKGSIVVSEGYVSAVLRACGLPQDW